MKHKVLSLLLVALTSISLIGGITAYAEPSPPQTRDAMPEVDTGGGSNKDDKEEDKTTESGGANEEEKAKAWEVIVGKCGDNADNVKLAWSAIRNSDYSEIVCSGILGNMLTECAGNPAATNGSHFGLFQWGDDRFVKLKNYSQAQNDTSVDINGHKIGGIATQISFMLCELTPGGAGVANFQYPSEEKLEEFKASKTPTEAADSFRIYYERCGEQGAQQRRDYAEAIFTYFAGTEIDVPEDKKEEADELATQMVSVGLWKETDFVKWKTSTRSSLQFSDIQALRIDDIGDIEDWEADIRLRNSDSLLIRGGRWLTILFGIIFNVWMLLIYISYWFDRLNNFFDYSLLNIVTFGRLLISPDESECTFSLTSLGKGEKRTVNHRKILEVVIIGLAFGTMIVSGVFFRILSLVVNKILEILY